MRAHQKQSGAKVASAEKAVAQEALLMLEKGFTIIRTVPFGDED